MLDLNDDTWLGFENYSDDPLVVRRKLEALYASPGDLGAIHDLASLVSTRDGTLNAAYAVAPHFLALRKDDRSPWDAKYQLLIETGKFALFDKNELFSVGRTNFYVWTEQIDDEGRS